MSFQSRFKAVGTPSRIPERVWKRVLFHRTCNGESPTTKRAETASLNHQLATVCRSKALTAWNVGCTRAAVLQVLRSRHSLYRPLWSGMPLILSLMLLHFWK